MASSKDITPDHILVFTISQAINQWMMEKGGRFVFGYGMGIDRCADISDVIFKCLPEAKRIIEENKHRFIQEIK